MRSAVKYAIAATMAAGANAAHQHQGHQLFHAKKDAASPVEKRDPAQVVAYVAGATETIYHLGESPIDSQNAIDGIAKGKYVVVGESSPEVNVPAPESNEPKLGAQFVEQQFSSEAPQPTVLSLTTSEAAPSSTSSTAAPSASAKDPPKQSPPKTGGGATGLDTPFPDGQIKCSEFPSDYGAVGLDWLGFNQWAGLQYVPDWTPNSVSIFEIHTGIKDDNCEPGAMCQYACPPGYMSTQYPKAQGSTKESIGGLYCNKDGYLELTREGKDTLCEKGAGGVSIQNDLDEVVVTCQTVYPGTEAMVIPSIAEAGATVELCNQPQDHYEWTGLPTSAQYYVNQPGYRCEDACVWKSDKYSQDAGNWAAVTIGVGYAADGNTYLSIAPNKPTSDAKLKFNIEITGDINGKCSLIDGSYPNGSEGCTTTMKKGGKAVFRYF